MTTQQAAELWPIIKAFSEGKIIQARFGPTDTWDDQEEPFRFVVPSIEYRIKPEPRVIWVNTNSDDDRFWAYKTKDEANRHQVEGYDKTIKFIEAI